MKDEKEFLQDMWKTVSKFEYEEKQKQLARKANIQYIRQQILSYACACLFFIAAWISVLWNGGFIYVVCLVVLLLGYAGETILVSSRRRSHFEDRNNY